jgi:hypothetical protein
MRTFITDYNTLGKHPGHIHGILDLELLGQRVRTEDGEGLSCEGIVQELRVNWQGSHLLVDIELDQSTWHDTYDKDDED